MQDIIEATELSLEELAVQMRKALETQLGFEIPIPKQVIKR